MTLEPEYMTTVEVAQLTRNATSTLRAWRMKGTGPHWCLAGRKVLYRRASVYEWLLSTDTGQRGVGA